MSTILVIDDDDALRGLIKALLERRKHSVIEAQDGEEGLEKLRAGSVDLVITDIMMPGKGGIETIRDLRSENQTVKVMAMSGGGNSRIDYLSMARDLGVNGTISKPFTPPEFLQAVHDLLS